MKRLSYCYIAILLYSFIAFSNGLFEKIEIRERFDYIRGLVILEKYSDSRYLGIEKVLTFDEYLEYRTRLSLTKEFSLKKERERKREEYLFETEGLIPEIAIPKLPIFGEGSKINISGSDRITLGGRQTFVSGVPTGITRPSLLPELKMEQQLRLNLDGTIGDRTKVLIDHDSEREFEGKNKVKLSYTGNEDEILQSLEAGDTRLGIPGTAYTGDLPALKGLFGISATGKLGGLNLYGVASREQSQAETKEFRGRTSLAQETIPDFEFEARRFFIVDTQDIQIKNLKVYVDDFNPYNNANQNTIPCLATIYPDRPGSPVEYSGDRYIGSFYLLKLGTDYVIPRGGNYIELTQSLGQDHILGVSYTIGQDSVGGQRFEDSLLVLKLLKPRVPSPLSKTWNYELRNIYQLRATEVKLETLIIYRKTDDDQIYRETETDGPKKDVPFTKILGLDPDGDGRVVYPQFDSRRGIIIFPERFPFAHPDLSVKDTLFYSTAFLPPDFRAKYYIYVKYSSTHQRFSLGQTDIEEGSVKVFVNNELWTRDVDYKLNYETGELDFIRKLPPNADIRVTFEYRPFFSLAQKSLMGLRGETKLLENGRLGSSVFYRSEGVPEYKPSLGAEPFRRMIGEVDFSYALKSEGLTNILDALPLLSASSPSSFAISGEAAVSLPDPNIRGVCYLDDFEGTLITRELNNKNTQWSWASIPVGKDTSNFARTPVFWFNPKNRIRKDSIFSGLGAEGRETQELLTIVFTPDDTGSWAGITQPSQYGMNLLEAENLELVFRMRSKSPDNRKARFHFSVGSGIDEDAPRRNKKLEIVGVNGTLDTEDKNQNGTLDVGEDIGIDGVFGKDGENIPGDDENDDYDPLKNPNGTEGNRLLDSEDLDQNGFSTINDYFEYTVELDELAYFQELLNRWRFLRIPLLDSTRYKRIGNPRWSDIRLVRFWFDGFRTTDTIDIYSISFVGSKWRNVRVLTLDSLIPVDSLEKGFVGQISKKTDPSYESPYTPRRDPYTGKFEFEAALQLKFSELNTNHYLLVGKRTYDREDWREYSALKIYLHKDETTNPDFILRFGGDSLNYYEYRQRIDKGSAVPGKTGWFEFTIDLDSFPVLKREGRAQGRGPSSYSYIGNPSLSEVRYYGLGVVNTSESRITGSVWVNELRLVSVRKEPGYASQGRLSINLSDFAALGFSISHTSPNFRRFSEPRGVKTGGFAVNQVSDARMNLDRFLPQNWNFSIPLTYRRSFQTGTPKYSTLYPDLRITRGTEEEENVKSFQEGWALTNIQKRKSGNKILNYTLEALSYSYQTSRSFSSQPLSIDTFRQVSNALSYGIAPNMKFAILGTEFSYFPNNIQIGLGVQKSKAPRWNIIKSDTLPDTSIRARSDSSHSGNFDLSIGYTPFENLVLDYGIASDRDFYVSLPDYLFGMKIGTEAGRDENFDAGYSLEIGEILTPRIDFNGDYREDRFKTLLDYEENRNVFNSGELDLGLDIELPEILEGLGKSERGEKDSILLPGSPKWIISNIGKLAENLEPLELSFSRSRSTDLLNILERPPFLFRLGLADIDTPKIRAGERFLGTRDYRDDFSGSSGAQVKDLKAGFRFDHSISRTVQGQSTQASWSTTFPDLTLSLSQVERYLKKWATSSSISSGFRRRSELSGTIVDSKLDSTTQNRSGSWEFSPVIGWQTTWKKRFTTNLTMNHSKTKSVVFFSQDTTENWSSGFNLSVSYAFSAPQGFKIPGLPKIRFSQELSLSANFGFSRTKGITRGPNRPGGESIGRDDANFTSQLSGSYRVSRSIESGVQTGFNTYLNRQSERTTRTISLDFWLLFRF